MPKKPPSVLYCFALLIPLLGGILGPIPPVEGAEPPIEPVIRKIQTSYETTDDWKAEFKQTVSISGFDSPVVSNGTLYIKKPGKLRWDYLKPTRDQVMVNEDTVWIYTPEQQQVIVSAFSEISDSQLPLLLLTGISKLDRDFIIEWPEEKAPGPDSPPLLRLTPKVPGTGISFFHLQVHPESFMITGLTLFEENGNQSRFQFSKIRQNTGLKDRLFVFKAPKGVVTVESPLRSRGRDAEKSP